MTEEMQKENDVVLLRNWINRAQAEYATRCQLAYLLRDLLDAETVGERDIVLARIKNHPDIKFRKMAGSGEPTVEPDYRSVDCDKCGRMRVEKSGICEKCKWNNDVGEYVSDSVLCGATISMHERDSTNDKPCVLEEGHPGDCAPRLPESVHDPAGVECSVKMSRPNLYVGGRKICTDEKSNPVPESVMPQGRWPDNCQQRAFVEGMKWWQFHHNGSTVSGSERDEAEKEAIRRYGIPPEPSMICIKNADGYHDWEPNTPLRDSSSCTACGVHANDVMSGLEPAAEVEVAECSRCRRPIYNMSGYYRHTHDDTTVCGYANDWPYIQPYVEEAAPEAAGTLDEIGRECIVTRDTHRLMTGTSEYFVDRMCRTLLAESRQRTLEPATGGAPETNPAVVSPDCNCQGMISQEGIRHGKHSCGVCEPKVEVAEKATSEVMRYNSWPKLSEYGLPDEDLVKASDYDAIKSRNAELEHHFDTLSFELSECTGIIAQQDVQIHWLKIPDLAKRIFELEEELARYPAKWWTDSSLETWFPLTAEDMERMKAIRHPEDKPDVDTPILVAHKTRKCWIICTWSGENWYEHQSYDLIFSGNVVGWKELPTLPRMETVE